MNKPVSFASASDTREQKPQLHELAPNVYGYISDFDPNCGFVVGDDHVVLIDTRPTPRMAREFLAAIRSVTDKPIKFIVLTHYHAVRVMGASAFDQVQAVISSHGTLDWVRQRGQADFAFHGLIGPAGMPQEAVNRINAELHKAMKAPKVVKLFADFGFEALPGTPQDFYKLSRAESERWGKIIKTAGVQLD